MRAGGRLLAAVPCLLAASCSLMTKLDSFSEPEPHAKDRTLDQVSLETEGGAGAHDPMVAHDGGTLGPGPNGQPTTESWPLSNAFETGADCDGWKAYNGSAEPVAGGRQSERACRVCRTGDMFADKKLPVSAAGTATFSAWAKRSTTEASTAYLHLFSYDGPIEPNTPISEATSLVLSETWTRIEVVLQVPTGFKSVTLRIRVGGTGCALLDDVAATYTN
jgi:hypothetical protein